MAALTVSKEEEKRLKGLGFLNNRGTDNFSARVITRNGKITAKQQIVLGEAAEKFGNGNITFTTRLTVEVQGIPYEKTEAFQEFIGKAGLETGGTGPKVRPVVSCKGTTCQYGLIDTFALSEAIHDRFYVGYHDVKLPHKFKIAVGGCPNKCVKPDLNDLGIIGQVIPKYNKEQCKGCKKCAVESTCPMGAAVMKEGTVEIDRAKCIHCGRCVRDCLFQAVEKEVSGYQMYIGGRWGKKAAAGWALSKIFTTEEEVLDAVEKTILLYKELGNPGERFADTVARIGFEQVEARILESLH